MFYLWRMPKHRDLKVPRVRKPILKQATTTAKIRVRLDNRTVITIQSMAAFQQWKDRYPNAVVISE
jgi:hypothetical protein